MIFAGIDVNIITHEKADAAGIEAFGLWCWAMCWAQLHTSDGRIPRGLVLGALRGKRNVVLARRLVDAGLWLANEDGSWTIWNYAKKNQTADEIRRKRDLAAERSKRWRMLRAVTPSDASRTRDVPIRTDPQTPLQTQTPPEPDLNVKPAPLALTPSEPVTRVRPKVQRGTRLPEDWTPSESIWGWAKERGISDPLKPLEEFRLHWGSLSGEKGVRSDWDKTYKNRLLQLMEQGRIGPTVGRRTDRVPRQQFAPGTSAPWMNPEAFDFGGDK